jgi:hypothetical protein
MKRFILLLSLLSICACKNSTQEYAFLKHKIEVGLEKEQEIREAFIKGVKIGKIDAALNQQIGEIDSINQLYAFQFLDTYGYPKKSKDGEKVSNGIFYILQHSDQKNMKTHIDALEKTAYEGEASLTHFALMKDRILMNDGEKQIYGSQLSPRKDENGFNTANYFVWPIENNSTVDSLRKVMGFKTSVAAYAKNANAVYDTQEELPKK